MTPNMPVRHENPMDVRQERDGLAGDYRLTPLSAYHEGECEGHSGCACFRTHEDVLAKVEASPTIDTG